MNVLNILKGIISFLLERNEMNANINITNTINIFYFNNINIDKNNNVIEEKQDNDES